jgi:hypothetical protein
MQLPTFLSTVAGKSGSRIVVAGVAVTAALTAFAALRFSPEVPVSQQSGIATSERTPRAILAPSLDTDFPREHDRELASYAPHGG